MSLCLSVTYGIKLSRAVILYHFSSDSLRTYQDDFRMTKSTQRALKEHSESTQKRAREQSDFVIPSEPKILRLVYKPLQLPLNCTALAHNNMLPDTNRQRLDVTEKQMYHLYHVLCPPVRLSNSYRFFSEIMNMTLYLCHLTLSLVST